MAAQYLGKSKKPYNIYTQSSQAAPKRGDYVDRPRNQEVDTDTGGNDLDRPFSSFSKDLGNLMGMVKQLEGWAGSFPKGFGPNGSGNAGLVGTSGSGGLGFDNLMGMAKQMDGLTGSFPKGFGLNGLGSMGFGGGHPGMGGGPGFGNLMGMAQQLNGQTGPFPSGFGLNGLGGVGQGAGHPGMGGGPGFGNLIGMMKQLGGLIGPYPFGVGLNGLGNASFGNPLGLLGLPNNAMGAFPFSATPLSGMQGGLPGFFF
ncbi:hypothetical protein ACNQFZ_02075 [Schinkia sp. CFF1]